MLGFRCRYLSNQLIPGNFANFYENFSALGAQGGLSRQLKTSIFLVRGAPNRSLSDVESRRFDDRILKGFEAAKSRKREAEVVLTWTRLGGSAAWRGAV